MTKIKTKTLDISKGITTQKLIDFLKQKGTLILNGKDKRIEIEQAVIRIFDQRQVLGMEHLPSKFEDQEVSEFQKKLLLKGETILVGNKSIKLNETRDSLEIRKKDGQQQMKIR